ncbi:OTU domain-containing protein [Pseudomonas sp. MRSN 12121]|uniref:OTU domain-containing protein n=1 Tax=Pseudomonas sp. MRSN 12121 TaxID=1611770 RepID=UPI000696A75E|nr:OTU domain-containing protein [Pseudomonas sp. MRSN 12121]
MSEFTDAFHNYYQLMQGMSADKLLLLKLTRLFENNVHSLGELEQILASKDSDGVMKYIQFHCNSENPWKDENPNKGKHVRKTMALGKLKDLRQMIERTTIAVLIATMARHNLSGGEHEKFLDVLWTTWKTEHYDAKNYRTRVHSSHLGLSPHFAHGSLEGNSVLAGMVALTEQHADSWHSYVFNVCLIKIADNEAQKAAGMEGRFLLVTQNNRSCFTHGVSQIPPLVFKLCADDLTANFRKFRVFEESSLNAVVACKDNLNRIANDKETAMTLALAEKQSISPCLTFLEQAYQGNDEARIKKLGRRPAYTHACLETTSIATIIQGPEREYRVSVPAGLYEHGGPLTLDSPGIFQKLWHTTYNGKPLEPRKVGDMTVIEVADDGHCLFAAIGVKTGDSVKELRSKAAEYLQQHPALIKEEKDQKRYLEALNNMDKDILWGGFPEIMALAEKLGRVIVLHQDGKQPTIYQGDIHAREVWPVYQEQDNDIHIYYCSTQGPGGPLNHFDALIKPA